MTLLHEVLVTAAIAALAALSIVALIISAFTLGGLLGTALYLAGVATGLITARRG